MSEPVILFIVEGEKRDYHFVNEMARCFMTGPHEVKYISLPAAQNLYMLYEKLCADDFETDVVELLRESVPDARAVLEGVPRRAIAQTYMFFDFDPHHNNLGDGTVDTYEVVARMLEVFDNETEHGKLYISYPMVEALYDYKRDYCQAFTKCFISLDDIGDYKRASGEGNSNASVHMNQAIGKT